jgi:hypothetical protein
MIASRRIARPADICTIHVCCTFFGAFYEFRTRKKFFVYLLPLIVVCVPVFTGSPDVAFLAVALQVAEANT